MFTDNKVWVTVSYAINLGSYENLKVEAGASQSVVPGKSIEEMHTEMIETFTQLVVKKAELARDGIEDIKDELNT